MAQNVTLVFPNIKALWDFAQAAKIRSMEINTLSRTLVCDSDRAEIQIAQEKYNAIVRHQFME
jgi:hypothetical protein